MDADGTTVGPEQPADANDGGGAVAAASELATPDVAEESWPATLPGPTPVPAGSGPRSRRPALLALAAVVLLAVGAALGYAVSRPTVSDLESSLSASRTETADTQAALDAQSATLRQAQAAVGTCQAAAAAATKALGSWSAYLDSVQSLYRAQTNAQADAALAQMAKRYRTVVAQTVPTATALTSCSDAPSS